MKKNEVLRFRAANNSSLLSVNQPVDTKGSRGREAGQERDNVSIALSILANHELHPA
jgi:hypothetical protein